MVETAIAVPVIKWVLEKLREHSSQNDDALRGALDADARKWRVERDAAVEQRLTELAARADSEGVQHSQLTAMLADLQFWRLQAGFEWEALREATDARRRMLAFAAAGLFSVDLTIEQKARVERALRALDPSDVLELRRWTASSLHIHQLTLGKAGESTLALLAAHCLIASPTGDFEPNLQGVDPDPDMSVRVTQLGRRVVTVLDPYYRAIAGDGTGPGGQHG